MVELRLTGSPLVAAPEGAGPVRRPRAAVLGAAWAVDEIRSLLRLEGDRVLAEACASAEGAAGPSAFEAVILHAPRGADVVALVREHAALLRAPIVVACEALSPGILFEALEAGASDCVEVGPGRGLPSLEAAAVEVPGAAAQPGPLTYAVFRAAAQSARLASERRRVKDLADALARARTECDAARAVAITDVVTGLFNKRHFFERLDEEENKAWRTGHPISLLLVDLDHFKSVNDTWGHDVGDKVLRGCAQVIRQCTRNYDIPCRFGGEEFAVILPTLRADRAFAVAERVRRDMKTHVFEDVPSDVRVTASCGVADLPGPQITTKEELIRAADRALYKSKAGGRDQTRIAEESRAAPLPGAEKAAADLVLGTESRRYTKASLDRSEPRSGGVLAGGPDGLSSLSRDVVERVDRLRVAIKGLSDELSRTYERAVDTLVRLVEDGQGPRVFGRSETIARYAERIAAAMDLGAEQVERIRRAGLLQELGMVPLAGRLVHDGALDAGEQALVRQHPALSVRIADELGYLRDELPIILHHHENFDGTGYPRGLRGERIPLGSRVLGVAMAFEAMTSERPYRRPLSTPEAIAEIQHLSGRRYDPRVVQGFSAAFRESA
jgi:diguanylate cyclase (GGDEF)-like protein